MEKKPLARYLQTLHVYSTSKQRKHDVFTLSPRRFNTELTHCIYKAKKIIKRHTKESLLQRNFRKIYIRIVLLASYVHTYICACVMSISISIYKYLSISIYLSKNIYIYMYIYMYIYIYIDR